MDQALQISLEGIDSMVDQRGNTDGMDEEEEEEKVEGSGSDRPYQVSQLNYWPTSC